MIAGEVAVQAGSHCIIFSADLAGSQFPIFGAGKQNTVLGQQRPAKAVPC